VIRALWRPIGVEPLPPVSGPSRVHVVTT